MTTLRIADGFSLPPEAITETFAILAKRGVGKTYTALVIVEEMLKTGLPVVVCDPIGVCWGLRASADGKSDGLPIVVMGGDYGDVPLEVTAGEIVADLIIEERLSVVLDLSRFRKGEQTRFMTDFAERLYHKNRSPLHLILDEADAFAPQRPMPGQQRLLGAVEDLVRRGRARGLGITLVTQRAAVLNKDVLTQAEVLVALRTIAPQDRSAIDEWVKVHGTPEERNELMTSLPSLPIGTAWFWSPGWLDVFQRVKVRKRETFDSSATPKVGQKLQPPKKLAEVDLSRLRERIAATIERAKAEDPKELKKRIAGLERELRKQKDDSVLQATVAGYEARLKQQDAQYRQQISELTVRLQKVGPLAEQITSLAALNGHAEKPAPMPTVSKPMPSPVTVTARPQVKRGAPTSSEVGTGGLRRILIALAQRPQGMSGGQLGIRAQLSSKSGTFSSYLSAARTNGWIQGGRDHLKITEAGLTALGDYEPLPTGRALLEYWLRDLGDGGASRMLTVIANAYPNSLSREEIAERAGMSLSGTFSNYMSKLRTLELIQGRSEIKASDELFD